VLVPAQFTSTRTAAGWRVTKVGVLPTWMEYHPHPRVVNLAAELARPGLTAEQREDYREAYRRIVGWVSSRGARAAGLTILR